MAKEVFKWEDPPAKQTGRPQGSKSQTTPIWVKRLAKLATRPGNWAVVYTSNRNSCSATLTALKKGRMKGVDPSNYEFTTRILPGQTGVSKAKKTVIYARYIAKPAAAEMVMEADPELEKLLAEEEEIEEQARKDRWTAEEAKRRDGQLEDKVTSELEWLKALGK